MDKSIARQAARDRKWMYQKEPILTYFYDKVKLLSNSFGERMDQADQCHEIREGLPDDLKPFVRTPLGGKPTLEHLRKELKLLEIDYVANKRKRPTNVIPQLQSPPPQVQGNIRNVKQEYGSSSRTNSRRVPLKESFNPKMIGQSPNPSNPSQMIRTYTIPDGSGRVLMLNRPCRVCNGNHFDFEPVHVHSSSSASDSSSNFDLYPMFTPAQSKPLFSIDYPAFVPQRFDPEVQTSQAAYPSYPTSMVSNEDYAYQMMRTDTSFGSFSPDSANSSRFEEEEDGSFSTSSTSPPQAKN